MAPSSPTRKASGPKTAMVVAKDESTPGITAIVPFTAAAVREAPSAAASAMESEMTIESSITIPMAINKATSVIMFSDSP